MTNNNKNSNGPKTDEGKAISSRNSVTHGLTARRWLDANEQSLYDETVKNLIVDFDPQTYIEKMLITKMAECSVRLVRIQKVEDAMFDLASDEAGNLLEAVKSIDNNSDRLIPAVQDTISVNWEFNILFYAKKIQMLIEIDNQKLDKISNWSYVESNMSFNSDYICETSIERNIAIQDFIAREANQRDFIVLQTTLFGRDGSNKKDSTLTIDEIFKGTHEISSTSLQKYFKNLKIRLVDDLQVQTVLRDSTERSQQLKDAAMPDTQKLHLVQRYRTADERQFSKTLKELIRLLQMRKNI
jgi:hypothetical protein